MRYVRPTARRGRVMTYLTVLLKGETTELCKWTVDIGSLPSYQENASTSTQNGFYTGTLYCMGLSLVYVMESTWLCRF